MTEQQRAAQALRHSYEYRMRAIARESVVPIEEARNFRVYKQQCEKLREMEEA